MSGGLGGCSTGPSAPPAIDLSQLKAPPIPQSTIDDLNAKVVAPTPPVSRAQTASFIDALRDDIDRKRLAAWRLVESVKQCRAPLEKLKGVELVSDANSKGIFNF